MRILMILIMLFLSNCSMMSKKKEIDSKSKQGKSHQEILDYWTKEKMNKASPIKNTIDSIQKIDSIKSKSNLLNDKKSENETNK